MKIIKPTSSDQVPQGRTVFLAGSIEMGVAENWQEKIENIFSSEPITILNPRRDNWDSTWAQEQSNPEFNYQVNWEMNMLDRTDIIFMYFSPETKSPISLLELGAYAQGGKMIVCCPDGFWRKGNVEIFCTRYRIPLFDNIDDAVGALRTLLHKTY